MAWMNLGSTRTGAVINITRLCLILFSVVCFALAVILAGKVAFPGVDVIPLAQMYLSLGLFVAGLVLLAVAAWFRITARPFLLSNILFEQMEKQAPIGDVESFLMTYKAQIGVAGFFNRLGFSGLSLGTIASAFLLLLVGMLAVQLQIVPKDQFSIFSDLAKLLFGAFIGSFASSGRGKTDIGTQQT